MRLRRNLIYIIISLFSLAGYAQFSLAPNGVTIVCPGANPGDTGVVDGVTYTAVSFSLLRTKRIAGEDLSLCCTTPVTSLTQFFRRTSFNSDISNWDTSNVTSMKQMFIEASQFNQDLSYWDTSNVTNMEEMFYKATAFNGDISGWDTSNVTNMKSMFYDAPAFDSDIGSWDTSSVITMQTMFKNSIAFNQDIGDWDVSNVTDMKRMFQNADAFNQFIGNWDVSNVTDMSGMFMYAYNYNQDLSDWDVNNVTTFANMFSGDNQSSGSNFNNGGLPLTWECCDSATDLENMFSQARKFNQAVDSWNMSNVTYLNGMFSIAYAFNQDLSNWDISNVTNLSRMFSQARNFNNGDTALTYNTPLTWDTSNVVGMNAMFYGATIFNQDITSWDTSNVATMYGMFMATRAFDQNLSSWDTSNVGNMANMFMGAHFDNGGQPLTWDTSSVTRMNSMFDYIGYGGLFSARFNQDISCWDTSSVTQMNKMFYKNTYFNQDISNWCVDGISSEPSNFTSTATLSDSNKPVWGTCPTTDRLVLTTNDSDNIIVNFDYGILEITASFTQSVTSPKISIGNLVTAQDMNVVSPTNSTYSWDVPNSVSPGTYTISIDNYSGCKNSLAITIIAPQTPPASSDPSQAVAEVSNDFYGEPPYLGNGLNLFPNRLAVSDDGNIIAAAGVHNNDGLGTNMNYVKVIDPSGSQIGQTLTYAEDGVDLTCTTSYGHGLAISGDGQRLFIGAPYHNTNRGRVRMYEYNSGSNTWDVIATLTSTLANTFFGQQIDTNQDGTLLFNNESNTMVQVYSIPKGSTTFTKLVGQNMTAKGSQFMVSRDGTAVIGFPKFTDYLSVYKYSGGTWNTITTATSLKNDGVGSQPGRLRGMDISDEGKRVVFFDEDTTPNSIHIYEYGGGTTWTKMASFQENPPDVSGLGFSTYWGGNVNISRDGNRVMVAAYTSQKPGDQYYGRGAFLIYEWDGTSWSQTDLVYGKVMSQLEGGVAKMSGDGSTFVTGARNSELSGSYNKGVVRVYRKTDDNDGDGYTNEFEALCGSDPDDASSRPADNDGDGSPDCVDTDDDNDGITDTQDCDPIDPLETLDTDSDGICNNDDTDDDNDGTIDTEDDLPLDPTETVDTDSDGTGNNADADDDNDGFLDVYETECLSDPLDSISVPDDIDGDFIPDCQDNDNDNDGVTDDIETQCGTDPLDSSSTPLDTDLDGTLDCFDLDDDNDSYNDNDDDFPLDATEWLDTDGDGVGNNADEDDDNDGYWDYEDFFQFDPLEWFDFDKDGIGDNADTDDDNDGYPDDFDAFPFNPFEWVDTDGDGVGNNDDTDNDDDGIPDSEEENIDTDGDGLNNDVDNDDDGDGIPTLAEDANGNGDPTDDDEDGDGIYDALESSIRDFDSDGVVDQLDNDNTDPYNDSDGDGYSNQDETKAGTDPLDNTEYPEDFESEELNFKITNFFSPNGDGIDDQWRIKEVDRYPKSQIWIFLRTGKEIFYASPYQNNWDGNFKGNLLPSGSYYYRLDLDGNGKIDFEGWLYLQR